LWPEGGKKQTLIYQNFLENPRLNNKKIFIPQGKDYIFLIFNEEQKKFLLYHRFPL
jgi:hypothetical protein